MSAKLPLILLSLTALLSGCASEGPPAGTAAGAVPMALWIGLFALAVGAVFMSVAGDLIGRLYVLSQPGHDDRPPRAPGQPAP